MNYRFDWVADWLNLKTNQTAETIWDKAQITHEAERLATNPDYSWQKALWKRLSQKEFRERFAWKGYETLKLYASEASREQKIENEPAILHFFAPFGISPLMLGVIKDLAEHEGEKGPKDVYAYILNPCRDYWFDSYGKDSDSDGKIIDYLRKNSAASRAMINRFYAFAEEGETAELVQQRIFDYERIQARTKLAETEKRLSGILYEHGVDSKGFALIRSKGDKALFRIDTALLKRKLGAPESRPLADFLPTISIKAKDFAAEMTSVNVQQKDLYGQQEIGKEHVDNNAAVRDMLLQRGIVPEQLPPSEDVKKVERRLKSEEKRLTGKAKKK